MNFLRNSMVLLFLLVILPVQGVSAQTGGAAPESQTALTKGTTVSKERELKLLQLEEAKIKLGSDWNTYQRAETDYEGMKELYDKQYVSGQLYEQALTNWQKAEADYENAKINLRRTELNFLQDASRISVIKATQRINEDIQRVLDFTLMNTSNVTEALVTDADLKNRQAIEARLRIENILVTVLNQGIQIGKPFEIVIDGLDYGETYEDMFVLQQEKIESVQLKIEYLGKVDNRTVYMEKQSGEDIPRVTSIQFAQEGNAGETVEFDLELERLAEDAATFALELVNLPEYIRGRFDDQGNMLTQVKFPERVASRELEVHCYIPEETSQDFLDKPIDFFALVGDEKAVKELKALEQEIAPEPITVENIENLKIGYEMLRLTPRGRPEMRIDAPNLYFEIDDPSKPVEIRVVVRNTGTATLREVRLETDKPYDWIVSITPDLLDKIDPREEVPADISVILPEGIGTGIYDLRAVVKCQYQGQAVQSPDKEFRINVKSRVNVLGTIILVTALVVAMLGVAVFTVRLARR